MYIMENYIVRRVDYNKYDIRSFRILENKHNVRLPLFRGQIMRNFDTFIYIFLGIFPFWFKVLNHPVIFNVNETISRK